MTPFTARKRRRATDLAPTLFERTELFSGHRYRLAQTAPRGFLDRIDAARAASNMEAAR